MVAGVGGAGGNAVNHMFDLGIKGVSFMVANTDEQALRRSMVPTKIQMGPGLGAGNKPERARKLAIESIDAITSVFAEHGTRMVFVTAGMGGGTGTGAAPIIAKAARDMGVLTVGIVTMPYASEGPKRIQNALEGIEELKKHVDSLIIINNENIQEIYGDLPLTEAFDRANDILATAAKGLAEMITRDSYINVDFADVQTVMTDSGIALMGSARAEGDDRVSDVVYGALSSPLLNHNSIEGATEILFNISYGRNQVTMGESNEIMDLIQARAGREANIIWGAGYSDLLGDEIELTIIATKFKTTAEDGGALQPIAGRLNGWKPPHNPFGDAKPLPEDRKRSDIIEIEESGRYRDIDRIWNTPAYIRRRVRLIPDGSSSAKVKMQNAAKKASEDNKLF